MKPLHIILGLLAIGALVFFATRRRRMPTSAESDAYYALHGTYLLTENE